MANGKYYAVARGRQTGIFTDWSTTKSLVDGFTGARYKGFTTRAAAEEWLAHMQVSGQQRSHARTSSMVQAPTREAANASVTAAETIQVFTDGGSRNTGNVNGGHVRNTDLAAWAYLIILPDGQRHQDSHGEIGATNNKMELTALKMALTKLIELHLNTAPILLTSDSHYVLDPIMKNWLAGWQRRGWRKSSGGEVLNLALWQAIVPLLDQFTQLQFKWVKGHATAAGNNYVDDLLNQTMDQMKDKE